jgi:hypothetical protein
MNTATGSAICAALAASIVLFAPGALASHQTYASDSNATAHCQAFAPGPTNTVRNRVTGAENIGAAMNVACAFESIGGYATVQPVATAGVRVANNGGGTLSVSCSELSGYFGNAGTVLNKSTESIAPGDSAGIDFSADDTPDEEDGDLGSYAVGIVCNLPTHALVADTHATWDDEDGIQSNGG